MKWINVFGATFFLHVLSAVLYFANAESTVTGPASCPPVGDLSFLCGLNNMEDIVPVGDRWLVGSSSKAGAPALYLIDVTAKSAKPVSLSIASRPEPIYAGCDAPDLEALRTHGLDVVAGRSGISTVFAINHGGRESVEVFHLNTATSSAEWVGCAILPSGASGNSVAALPNNSFAITKFVDPADKQGFQNLMAGGISGAVYVWMPATGFSEVPGTQLAGNNGLAASTDGRWLYIAAYGTREIYRVPLSGKGERTSIKVDFNPDNLRWAPDGTLFVTGQFMGAQFFPGAQRSSDKRLSWSTVRLDPRTMKTTVVVNEPGTSEFEGATSTVQAGQTLWFATARGDRIAYRAIP